MYLRATQRRNRDGSVVRYLALAHNRRVEGITQAQVLLNLGREDQLDRDALARLVTSINRYLGEGDPDAGELTESGALAGEGLSVTRSRPVGARHLLEGLWAALDVRAALAKVLRSAAVQHRCGAGALRVGGQPGDRADEQALRGGVGNP